MLVPLQDVLSCWPLFDTFLVPVLVVLHSYRASWSSVAWIVGGLSATDFVATVTVFGDGAVIVTVVIWVLIAHFPWR